MQTEAAGTTTPSTQDPATVLVGVKGGFASLTGCAALDPRARWCGPAFIDGVRFEDRR